jgi:hypothetical protein
LTDLWILWEWVLDAPFVAAVVREADAAGVSTTVIGPDDVAAARDLLLADEHAPSVVLDRSSDVLDEAFQIAVVARGRGSLVLNDPDRVPAAIDKARMHLALMSVGVQVPWTIVASALDQDEGWERDQLPRVGSPFVIKPAHGCGGEGVVLDAACADDVDRARALRPAESHLLQEFIRTQRLGERPAYFRALYCLGEVSPCFWDPDTRCYAELQPDDPVAPLLAGITPLAQAVAGVAGMTLFSTEVALSEDGRLVAVDYVNDMCDLRLASQHPDGIPDAVVQRVAARIARATAQRTARQTGQ